VRKLRAHGLALLLAVVSLGAAQRPPNPDPALAVATAKATNPASQPRKAGRSAPYQVGTASWYGEYFQGRATATGEPYNMYDLTAAHPTLPLGTWVRVTNLHNGRAVTVRINDRGPVVDGRIIDVSYSAAKVLQFKEKGLQRVRLDIVHPQMVASLRPVAY
jgi:peptidoglycan lytic transglycosylase